MSSPPPPRKSPAWLRLHDALFGMAAGVLTGYGVWVFDRHHLGLFGQRTDLVLLALGVIGVGWTCLDMATAVRLRAQGLLESSLVGGNAAGCAVVLAGISISIAMTCAMICLQGGPRGTWLPIMVRASMGVLCVYFVAIVLWLHRETTP